MMITKRFLIILAVSFVLYLIIELFFENAMLYIMGGVVGGIIQEIFRSFGEEPGSNLIFSVWVILLIGLVIWYYQLQYRPLKYFFIVIIAAFLYVIDNLIAGIPVFDIEDIERAVLINKLLFWVSTFSKSLFLSLIFYYGTKRKNRSKFLN